MQYCIVQAAKCLIDVALVVLGYWSGGISRTSTGGARLFSGAKQCAIPSMSVSRNIYTRRINWHYTAIRRCTCSCVQFLKARARTRLSTDSRIVAAMVYGEPGARADGRPSSASNGERMPWLEKVAIRQSLIV
jgi:hypothetical protein